MKRLPEIWRVVQGFPYEVSDYGRVRRVGPPGKNVRYGRILASPVDPLDDYRKVSLWHNGKGQTFKVHVLVCLAFHGPKPFPDAQVRHRDGDKGNNKDSNLCWGTAQENMDDRKVHGHGWYNADSKVRHVNSLRAAWQDKNKRDRRIHSIRVTRGIIRMVG